MQINFKIDQQTNVKLQCRTLISFLVTENINFLYMNIENKLHKKGVGQISRAK